MSLRALFLALAFSQLQGQDPVERLRPLLGIPYVVDAGEDEAGRYVLFIRPGEPLPEPGLNCSGFVVAACRRLLGFRGTLAQAALDRKGDSGADSPQGRDWDFGLDLILNLSEGRPRRFLSTGSRPQSDPDGRAQRGFALGRRETWEALRSRLRPKALYLASLSHVKDGRLAHHHVALLLKDRQGRSWFYHTLPRGKSHRVSLDTPAGLARLGKMFGRAQKMIVLEVDLG